MSDWRNKIPHEQVESDPTKQNIITGQLHRLIKLGVLMPEASQISDTGIYVTIGLPSPTGTSKLQVGGTVAANEAEYDYELATLGQVKALAVPTLPQLKTINNESIVGTGNIVISGGVDITLGTQKNGLILVGQELSLGLATNLVSGALSNTDWNTFNSKQNALGFTPENIANKNQNNGYAGLDSTGKINPLHLPALAITDTFVVGSESEMLSLVAEVGDVAIRTDLNKSFILCVSGASTLANWQELLTSVTVDQTIIDGSTNAVSGNAVFDGLALKANLASPAFTGTPTAPTAITGTNTTQVATTAFVANSISFATSTFVTTNTTQVIGASKTFGIDGQGHGFTFVVGLTTKTAYFTGDAFAFGHISANPGIGRKGNHVAVYSTGTMGFASLDTSLISSGLNNRVFTFPNQDGTFALVNNATSITATSFVKSGAATANILLAGGGDIPQSTFATSFNPTFTGSVVVPNATLATEAVNKGQLDAAIPTFLKFNATDRTVWNNGKNDIVTNTTFGDASLPNNTTGSANSSFGVVSMLSNTTGSFNSSFGNESLRENVSGALNNAFGYYSLRNNISGWLNVGIGAYALTQSLGDNNVGIGSSVLSGVYLGNSNVGIGFEAGRYFNGGGSTEVSQLSNSIYIGAETRASANNVTNEIVIGYQSFGAGSNTVTIGNSNITKTILGGVIQKRALDTAPASATATGTTGEIRVTSTHIYVCIATNTWVHSVLTTW